MILLSRYYLGEKGITELVNKYKFYKGNFGDQDWMTLLSMSAPELIYPLSCMFNRQIGIPFHPAVMEMWKDIFMDFFACEDFAQDGKQMVNKNAGNIYPK